MSGKILIFKAFGFASLFALTFSALTFYNFECKSFDKSFSDFEYCYIKAVNRSLKYFSVKLNLFKLPITSGSFRIALSYRANGWKPFLYNYTVNLCSFLKSKRKKCFLDHMYKTIEKFTNLNHSCPLNHDLMVNNVTTSFADNLWTKVLPTPEGQYRVNVIGSTGGMPKFETILYVKIS